jgi:hypothetical protein
MHAKNFFSEFLDIFKNDFRPTGAYAPMNQNEFSIVEIILSLRMLVQLYALRLEKVVGCIT